MKVVIITERIFPLIGGAETRYNEISHRLSNRGHDVSIITGRGDITSKKSMPFNYERVEHHNGVKIHRIFNYQDGNFKPETRSLRNCVNLGIQTGFYIKHLKRINDIDVLDLNVVPQLHIPFFRIFGENPSILTWHEVWGPKWRDLTKFSKLGKEIEFINAQFGRERIAVSKFTAKRLKNISLRKKQKINVIENGISDKFFEIENISSENPRYLYVGRLYPHKNVHSILYKGFLELQKTYPHAKLDIVGNGRLKPMIKSLANRFDNITYYDNVNDEKLLQLYASANIFVTASSREGSGIAAKEANAAGLPVVTINFPDNAIAHETIISEYNGIISQANCFGDSMKIAYENKDKMILPAKKIANKFKWEPIINRLEKVYERINTSYN